MSPLSEDTAMPEASDRSSNTDQVVFSFSSSVLDAQDDLGGAVIGSDLRRACIPAEQSNTPSRPAESSITGGWWSGGWWSESDVWWAGWSSSMYTRAVIGSRASGRQPVLTLCRGSQSPCAVTIIGIGVRILLGNGRRPFTAICAVSRSKSGVTPCPIGAVSFARRGIVRRPSSSLTIHGKKGLFI